MSGDFYARDGVAGSVGNMAGKTGFYGIALGLQGKADYRNCEEEKGSSKKSLIHFILRSLSRGS